MVCLKTFSVLKVIPLVMFGVIFSVSVQASVKYKFVVTSGPTITSHTPFMAELVLSDSAVAAGEATSNDVDSLRIVGGNYIPVADPIVFTDLHAHFINLVVTLSPDRETIALFYAQSSQNMQEFDYWVFFQHDPNAPGQNVHDNGVEISADSIIMRTLLLPDYTYAISEFTGQWQRLDEEDSCRLCKIIDEYVVGCFPWCPWPWILIGSIILVAITVRSVQKQRSRKQ